MYFGHIVHGVWKKTELKILHVRVTHTKNTVRNVFYKKINAVCRMRKDRMLHRMRRMSAIYVLHHHLE